MESKKGSLWVKTSPRAWYELLDEYLFQQGFKTCIANRNIYLKIDQKSGILVIVVCVDDIIYGCNYDKLSHEFANLMAL